MCEPIREGQLFVQQQKFGIKSWKKNRAMLYANSGSGVARLEYYESKESGSTSDKGTDRAARRADKRVLRLADCVSVRAAPLEVAPRLCVAFLLETAERHFVFAAELADAAAWVRTLCELAFPKMSSDALRMEMSTAQMEMEENSLYGCRDSANEYWVSIHKTEASERCGLVGSYKLKGDKEDLTLKDPASGNAIYVWPYKLLRRFGRDKTSFTFEAGRRCNSGPGTFMFDTKNGNDIFTIIEESINQTKLNRNSQNYTDGDTPHAFACLFADEEVAKLSLVKSSQNYDRRMAPPQSIVVKPFPISPSLPGMSPTAKSSSSAGSTPPRSPLPRPPLLDPCLARLEPLQDVYADPADSLMLTIKLDDKASASSSSSSHYHDPETENNHPCVTGKLRSNGLLAVAKQQESAPEPVYSDPYEKVEQKNTEAPSSRRQERTPEHIYDEPEGIEKPASLYDEALQIKGDAWKVQAKPEHAYNEQPFTSPIDSFPAPLPASNPQKTQSMESPPSHAKNTEQAPQLPPKPRQMVAQKFGLKPPTTEPRGWNTANSNNSNSKLCPKPRIAPKPKIENVSGKEPERKSIGSAEECKEARLWNQLGQV
ncbi:unnamed protein product [Lampetra planeri]